MQTSTATVDVIPLFLEKALDLEIDSEDLIISSPLIHGEQKRQTQRIVCIHHIPTGITVQSSGMHILVLKCRFFIFIFFKSNFLFLSFYIRVHLPEFANEIAMPYMTATISFFGHDVIEFLFVLRLNYTFVPLAYF